MGVKNKLKTWNHAGAILLLAAICALTVFACLFAYRFDNKYTAAGPKAHNGLLKLDTLDMEKHPDIFLTDGWEYYGGRLLSPGDFSGDAPSSDQYIFIGQYGGFEAGDQSASPHGSASYRLNIAVPDEPRTYTLELPEIFSAYRLYINGMPAAAMGNPDPQKYRAETGNKTITFEARENIEILFAVSDFSHLYSGMVYPPAFGTPDAVSRLLYARFLFRAALCACALTIGLLSLLVGLLTRNNTLAILYGLLCLFFIGYACYPITQTVIGGSWPLYVIENFSFCAMLVVVMLLQRKICGFNEKWSGFFILFGLLACAASIILPFIVAGGSFQMMMGYSTLISAYEWITAAFITYAAIRTTIKDTVHFSPILCGIIIFDCALVMDRLLPLYEPVVTGWFIELASFALVLCIGVAIGREVALQYQEKAVLEERANSMERLYEMQQVYYTVLQQEMKETKTMKHDMRHHFVMIDGFLKNRQYDQLEAYVAEYHAAVREGEQADYSPNNVINVLAHHYNYLSEQDRIHFDMRCEMGPEVKMADADLCGLLGNLLENAVEACRRVTAGRRFIRFGVVRMGDNDLVIRVENSTDGNVVRDGEAFLSSKGENRKGYGLESVKSIARRYDGDVILKWDRAERVFTCLVTLTA